MLIFFSMSGGTGSGMVVDLARHLSNVKLGRRIPVVGVAAMPFSGDEEHAGGAAALYPTMNEIDCMLDDAKNQGVMAVWGDLYKNPFTGGFFALPQEHSWQRLGSYTKTGKPAIRDALRKGVTRKFVNDSFMRFVVQDYGRLLFKMLRPMGFTGAPHERNISGDRTWTIFDVAKFTHPGVEVLPGRAAQQVARGRQQVDRLHPAVVGSAARASRPTTSRRTPSPRASCGTRRWRTSSRRPWPASCSRATTAR